MKPEGQEGKLDTRMDTENCSPGFPFIELAIDVGCRQWSSLSP